MRAAAGPAGGRTDAMQLKREHQINFWYAIAALLAVLAIRDMLVNQDQVRTIPYSEFQHLSTEGKVTDLVIGPTRITGTLKDAAAGEPRRFSTVRVDPQLAATLAPPAPASPGNANRACWRMCWAG